MSHYRVIPRDFFNEAKLLKCLGKLELFIMESPENQEIGLRSEHDGEPFEIIQDPADGSLSVRNYKVYLKGDRVYLCTPYNSKDNWPLEANYRGATYYCFDEEGNFMTRFGIVPDEGI